VTEKRQRLIGFFSIAIGVSTIWLIVLPWISRWESVEQHIHLLEMRRIDASAMFYSELEDRPIQ